MSGNSRIIPNFIKASGPNQLRRFMLRNNLKKGKEYNYEIIFASGKWYAWFNEEEVLTLPPEKESK